MVDVRESYPRIRASGAEVAAVGMGDSQRGAEFRGRYALPFVVLSDPDRRAYQAYGLVAGSLWQLAGPQTWLAGLGATLRQGVSLPTENALQMPGSFVIDRQGVIRFAHYPKHQADAASLDDWLAAIPAGASNGGGGQTKEA